MTRYCNECNREFEPKADWMRLCWNCWRRREDRRIYQCGRADGYDEGYEAGHAAGLWTGSGASHTTLNGGLLRELVALCHPDRHPPERAVVANRVTAALLEMIDRERKVA
jgi:hypothetical protein